jgi:hypothetical protein
MAHGGCANMDEISNETCTVVSISTIESKSCLDYFSSFAQILFTFSLVRIYTP